MAKGKKEKEMNTHVERERERKKKYSLFVCFNELLIVLSIKGEQSRKLFKKLGARQVTFPVHRVLACVSATCARILYCGFLFSWPVC